MGTSSVNDEKLRRFELALKKKQEQELNYYKYLQEQDLKNLKRTYEEAKRINDQLKSYNNKRFNNFKSINYDNDYDY